MSPAENRIVKALAVRPMTVNELANTVYVEPGHLRHLLRRLADARVVRIGARAPRAQARGATPRYWERVA